MKKYNEALLPIVEKVNVKAFKIASMLSILGMILIGLSVVFLEVGTIRTIGVTIGVIMIGLPFILRFFIDKDQNIGVIRFTDKELLTKLKGEESKSFSIDDIRVLKYEIIDYEGETKAIDLLRSSSRMNVRSGTDNTVFWETDDDEFYYKFKLGSELAKRKALYFLKLFEGEISDIHNTN